MSEPTPPRPRLVPSPTPTDPRPVKTHRVLGPRTATGPEPAGADDLVAVARAVGVLTERQA